MMPKHIAIILRVLVYILMVMFIEFGKAFKDVGAAKLASYGWSDWLVDIVSTGGQVFVVINAYFDRSFGDHMLGRESAKPALSPQEFNRLMADWKPPSSAVPVAVLPIVGAELPKTP